MSTTTCPRCSARHWWSWEEAFDKFGFDDGDSLVMTPAVVAALKAAGYEAKSERWGCHNEVIVSILKDGIEQIPDDAPLGYGEPREYLPTSIVDILDEALPEGREVQL